MPEMDSRAWWDEVQHLRAAAERRQSAQPETGPVFAPLTLVDDDKPPRGFSWDPSAFDENADRPVPARRFVRQARAVPDLPPPTPAPPREPELFVPAPAAVADARERQALRRTVTITGRPVSPAATPGLVEVQSRRPGRRAVERIGPRPDRVAMWAVALGLVLCIVALATASHP
jgi:hypothetical protein